jgi:hypothetical protein
MLQGVIFITRADMIGLVSASGLSFDRVLNAYKFLSMLAFYP